MIYQVYAIVNKLNGKMYVGSTQKDLKIRWQRHVVKANKSGSGSLQKAIRKYGKDNFDIRLIEIYPTKEAMFAGEIEYIAYFNTYKSLYGYNDTAGGEGGNTNGGKKFSEKWAGKISKSLAGKEKKIKRRFSEDIEKEICRLYVEEEKSGYSLGKQFDCQRTLIMDILQRNNIEVIKSNYTGHDNGKNIFSLEQEMEICNLYLTDNVSRSELARKFNCGKTTIRNIFIKHNIKI